MMVNQDKPI